MSSIIAQDEDLQPMYCRWAMEQYGQPAFKVSFGLGQRGHRRRPEVTPDIDLYTEVTVQFWNGGRQDVFHKEWNLIDLIHSIARFAAAERRDA